MATTLHDAVDLTELGGEREGVLAAAAAYLDLDPRELELRLEHDESLGEIACLAGRSAGGLFDAILGACGPEWRALPPEMALRGVERVVVEPRALAPRSPRAGPPSAVPGCSQDFLSPWG